MNKKILFSLGILILAIAIIYVVKNREKDFQTTQTVKDFEDFTQSNEGFKQGVELSLKREYQDAIPYLETSQNQAGSENKVFVEFLLANAYANTGELRKASDLFKGITKNTDYVPTMRADSVHAMATFLNLTDNEGKTFKDYLITDEPYSQLNRDYPEQKSFQRELLKYGVSLYPLATLEMMLASSYARDLTADLKNSPTEFSRIKNLVIEAVRKGDEDMKRYDPEVAHLATNIPLALLSKAIAAQYFYQGTNTAPFGDPEQLFKSALESAEKFNSSRIAITKYYYAVFLAERGDEKRVGDLRNLLSGFYTDEYSGMRTMFTKEKDDLYGEKKHLILLSSLDSKFKELLLSLGWQESDFSL